MPSTGYGFWPSSSVYFARRRFLFLCPFVTFACRLTSCSRPRCSPTAARWRETSNSSMTHRRTKRSMFAAGAMGVAKVRFHREKTGLEVMPRAGADSLRRLVPRARRIPGHPGAGSPGCREGGSRSCPAGANAGSGPGRAWRTGVPAPDRRPVRRGRSTGAVISVQDPWG